jgi:hypothetical protein
MLTFDIPVVIGITIASIILGALVGYSFRRYKISKAFSQHDELEREILQSHSEILQLQKDNLELLKIVDELKTSLNGQGKNTSSESSQSVVDISSHKKLFKKDVASGGKGID